MLMFYRVPHTECILVKFNSSSVGIDPYNQCVAFSSLERKRFFWSNCSFLGEDIVGKMCMCEM